MCIRYIWYHMKYNFRFLSYQMYMYISTWQPYHAKFGQCMRTKKCNIKGQNHLPACYKTKNKEKCVKIPEIKYTNTVPKIINECGPAVIA